MQDSVEAAVVVEVADLEQELVKAVEQELVTAVEPGARSEGPGCAGLLWSTQDSPGYQRKR